MARAAEAPSKGATLPFSIKNFSTFAHFDSVLKSPTKGIVVDGNCYTLKLRPRGARNRNLQEAPELTWSWCSL